MQRRQSTRTKPSSRGQTCLAGDQMQPRHENGKMDSGPTDPNLLGYSRHHGWQPQKAQGGPGTGKSGRERGMRNSGVQATAWADAPFHRQGAAVCTPGRGGHLPVPAPGSRVTGTFVFPPLFMSLLDPKSPAQSPSGPALSLAMSGTVDSARI